MHHNIIELLKLTKWQDFYPNTIELTVVVTWQSYQGKIN